MRVSPVLQGLDVKVNDDDFITLTRNDMEDLHAGPSMNEMDSANPIHNACASQLWVGEDPQDIRDTPVLAVKSFVLAPLPEVGEDEYLNRLHKYIQIVKAINFSK